MKKRQKEKNTHHKKIVCKRKFDDASHEVIKIAPISNSHRNVPVLFVREYE